MLVRWPRLHYLIPALVAVFWLAAQPAAAQMPMPGAGGGSGEAGGATLPDDLTQEAIRDVLSGLEDQQIRQMLLAELDKQAEARAAALASQDQRGFLEVAEDWGTSLGGLFLSSFKSIPVYPGAIGDAMNTFSERRGDKPLWLFFASVVLAVGGGLALSRAVRYLLGGVHNRVLKSTPQGLGSRVKLLLSRFGLQSLYLVSFLIGGLIINRLFNMETPPDFMTGKFIIEAVAITLFAGMCAAFVLAPKNPELRLCATDDASAKFLTRRIMIIFGWSAFGVGFLIWLEVFGLPQNLRTGFWVAVIYYGLMALTLWQARDAISIMVRGEGQAGLGWERFSKAWPKIAVGLVIFNFFFVMLLASTGVPINLNALDATLVVILALPLLEVALAAIVRAAWPVDPETDLGVQVAHRLTQDGIVRVVRIPVIVLLILGLASMWGLNLQDLASQGVGAQFAGAVIQSFVIVMIAYAAWEAMNIAHDRQIALDRAATGVDSEEEQEGEGGKGGTRLGTLMPLIRGTARFFILLLAGLAVLGEMGVNITPLLAGAGVLGLAIGFGAQTLVRDVLSGFFFLIDDAFRKGEYINLGDVAGTVESISIRSMQLRHHNGPLHTIPFGEIKYLTNFSRDWVMMKLPLRVTYDTDVEKLRKLIKKLGQQMLEDPELGPKFMEPLKSQGVIQMDDSAMIVRVKFKTKPGDQWTLRTKVFAKLRELFEKEGIKFAHREVTVRIADDGHHGNGEIIDGNDAARQQRIREEAAAGAARAVIAADEAAQAGKPPADTR
jgi:small-conductance mechanosensitive channel